MRVARCGHSAGGAAALAFVFPTMLGPLVDCGPLFYAVVSLMLQRFSMT